MAWELKFAFSLFSSRGKIEKGIAYGPKRQHLTPDGLMEVFPN